MFHAPLRTHRFSLHVSSVVAALVTAALTVCAGLAPDTALALDSPEPGPALEAAFAYDTVTGAAVTLAAGRTPGTFGVTHSGAATYRIPLWTPPGVGEVALDLALVYNSRAGNGVLGQGWALSGLSAISRCNRTVAQNGAAAGVRNTSADRFCLDGQQLKLVSGVYGGADSVYATEVESFARIVAQGVSGSGPLSFTVTSRNGLVYQYGGTADSRVHAGSTETVRTWALSSVRDRVGNGIALAYFNDGQAAAYTDGTYRVATITYPRTATGAGPFYEVRFGYSARASSDVPVGYLAGAVLREPNKLDSITVQAVGGAAPIKRYNLSYDVSAATGRIRLTGVQECAASSCLRPTTVTYQAGTRGWSIQRDTGVVASPKHAPVVADFDGDGLTDLLYPVNSGSSGLSWWIARATPDGFAAPFATGLYTTSTSKVIHGDFLGNGRTQFLVQQGGSWSIASYSGTGLLVGSTGLAAGGEYGAADVDGDGLADLVAVTNTTPKSVTVRRNVTTPAPGGFVARFASTTQTVWTVPDTRVLLSWNDPRVSDLNGDGRADLAILTTNTRDRNVRQFLTPMLSNGFGAPFTKAPDQLLTLAAMVWTADWNADGCSDVMQLQRVLVSDCAGSFAAVATAPTTATGTILPADWNGDGRTDLLFVSADTKTWRVVPSTGGGAGAPVETGIAAPDGSTWFVHDPDGDGLVDLGVRLAGDRLKFHLHASATRPADLATRFVDGFGLLQGQPTYVSIARSHHERRSGAQFPEADFQAPLYVVSEFVAGDGAGGTYRNQFTYAGARRSLQGRGFLGFETQRIVDTRSGLVTIDYAGRSYPFTSMHVGRSVFQANGSTPVSSWTAALAQLRLGNPGAEERRFPHVASNTRRTYEHGGALNGRLVTETTTTYTYADLYGNPTRVQTTTVDKDPTSPFLGAAWQSTATYAYANDASANWCLGLPISSTVTSTAPGQASKSRAATFAVDTRSCRVTQQVLEPATPSQKVSTTYGYDGCGNLASVRVVGSHANGTAMPARTTAFGYGSRCQLPETVTNALGQTTRYQYRYDFGIPTQTADPNGLVTAWTHDEYGRRTRRTLPDRTWTAWSYESCGTGACWGDGTLRFVVYESRLGADGVLVRSRQWFYDALERPRSDQYQRAGGIWTRVDYRYDALGRPVHQTRPYSTTSNGHSSTSFDPLGRITMQRDHDGAGALVRATSYAYSGRTVRITDPLDRTRSEVRDVGGRLRRVVDPAGGTTRYDYDAHGNLARIDDPIGGVSTGTYNARGFRTRWADASAGAWTYTGNSLNELTAWTDARGQSFSAAYDALGRLVSRTEPEGTSRFTWGTTASAREIGRLSSKTSPGYGESFAYDAAGRLSSLTIVADQTYRYDYGYNAIGELETLTYPASPVPAGQSGSRLKIRYGYSYGEPAQIDDVTQSQPRTLWKLEATNDLGLPSREALAAGAAITTSDYDLATGHLARRRSGSPGNPALHQSLEYQWDAAANLVQRRDARQNRTERFAVDAVGRVTGSTLDGVSNLAVTYDAAGNLRYRSDVGGYSYGNASRPHQATLVGAETLTYDANGNLASRSGVAQRWASFNLPTLVRKSGYQSEFAYGPDHQRWRQVATYPNGTETTHYVGGLLEKASTTSTGYTYWRHYVPTPGGATVVVSRSTDGGASTTYVVPDHLGSGDTLLDENGALRTRLSFDAFGRRRGADWSRTTPPDWVGISNRTRQGLTGHEMLDNVGLVHLGGRVYDPGLGRFLSVDPIIGDLGDAQTANPYAYVGNRVLSATDSTGYLVDGPCGGVCVTVVSSIVKTGFDMIFGGGQQPWVPPATAIPGQSAQGGTGICGPGTFSSTCAGSVLYAGAPPQGAGGPGTSSWVTSSAEDPYAAENLERFLIDLGVNAVDVLLLSPVYGARDSYEAARDGHYGQAVVILSLTACEVAKPCYALKGPLKALSGLATAVDNQLPRVVARVVAGERKLNTLGRPGTDDVFVVDANDIAGMSAAELSQRLTIPTSDTFTVIRFPTPDTGLASPVFRDNPGFKPGGLTRGGAREYVIPNGPVPGNATVEIVR